MNSEPLFLSENSRLASQWNPLPQREKGDVHIECHILRSMVGVCMVSTQVMSCCTVQCDPTMLQYFFTNNKILFVIFMNLHTIVWHSLTFNVMWYIGSQVFRKESTLNSPDLLCRGWYFLKNSTPQVICSRILGLNITGIPGPPILECSVPSLLAV